MEICQNDVFGRKLKFAVACLYVMVTRALHAKDKEPGKAVTYA